jgi:hypothetical protein
VLWGIWVKMDDMRLTCPKSQYLLIDDKIKSLADELLSNDDIQEAEKISKDLTKKSTKINAIKKLRIKIGDIPRRPMEYANFELNYLPYRTRNPVRYIGDFIDLLIKYLATEKLHDSACLKRSLGINLRKLNKKIPDSLYFQLEKYDNDIYKPAKHEFGVENRKHLFTSKEVVFIYFLSLKLKEQIIEISEEAKKCSECVEYRPEYSY